MVTITTTVLLQVTLSTEHGLSVQYSLCMSLGENTLDLGACADSFLPGFDTILKSGHSSG